MSAAPLMKKATAVWLIENTKLTFEQIADFCQLHRLEVQAIADGEVAGKMHGLNPVLSGQLRKEEIERAEKDPKVCMKMAVKDLPKAVKRSKGPKYTPLTKRQDKPDAIAWIIKNHPELTDAQIVRLIGTTKNTIDKIRTRTHWNIQNITPQNPISLGLCSNDDLDATIKRAQRKLEKQQQAADKAAGKTSKAPASEEAAAEEISQETPQDADLAEASNS